MRKPKTRLEYLRLTNLLSQKDVANHLGISQVYYGRLEKDPEKISLGMAQKLKDLMRVEKIDELMGNIAV